MRFILPEEEVVAMRKEKRRRLKLPAAVKGLLTQALVDLIVGLVTALLIKLLRI